MVEWRKVVGYENDYEVSSDGRVRSWRPWRNVSAPRYLTLTEYQGYHHVTLCLNGNRKHKKVHQLIADAFLPPPTPEQVLVRHLNGIRNDNRVENIARGTELDNFNDSIKHGTCYLLQRTPRQRKLDQDKRESGLTPQQKRERSERCAKMVSGLTTEERSRRAKKGFENMPQERKDQIGRKLNEASMEHMSKLSKDEVSAIRQKAWETRRANEAKRKAS